MLWCSGPNDRGNRMCKTKRGPPLEGTPCGTEKVELIFISSILNSYTHISVFTRQLDSANCQRYEIILDSHVFILDFFKYTCKCKVTIGKVPILIFLKNRY